MDFATSRNLSYLTIGSQDHLCVVSSPFWKTWTISNWHYYEELTIVCNSRKDQADSTSLDSANIKLRVPKLGQPKLLQLKVLWTELETEVYEIYSFSWIFSELTWEAAGLTIWNSATGRTYTKNKTWTTTNIRKS